MNTSDAFLAEDRSLPKKFAEKMISPTHFYEADEAVINRIRKVFLMELSVSSVVNIKAQASCWDTIYNKLPDPQDFPAS